MNWKAWLHGILAAAIGAGATGFSTVIVSPQTFNFTHAGLINLAQVCGLSALLAVAAVLKQSPLPPADAPASPGAGKAASLIVALLIGSMLMTTTGCDAQSTAADLIAIVGTATASLEALEGNTEAVKQIQADTKAATDAVTNWKNGTPAQDVIEALNILQDDLNLLPVSPTDLAFIDLAIGTVDQILALIPVPANAPAVSSGALLSQAVYFSARPHHVHHRHPHLAKTPKSVKEFRKEWNKLAGAHGGFALVLPSK